MEHCESGNKGETKTPKKSVQNVQGPPDECQVEGAVPIGEDDGEIHHNSPDDLITLECKLNPGPSGLLSTSNKCVKRKHTIAFLNEEDDDDDEDLSPLKNLRLNDSPARVARRASLDEELNRAPSNNDVREVQARRIEIDELDVFFEDDYPIPEPPTIEPEDIAAVRENSNMVENILPLLNMVAGVSNENLLEIADNFHNSANDMMLAEVLFNDDISVEDFGSMINQM